MGWKDYTPSEALVMIACQFIYAALILVTKKALSQDMSALPFVVYRQFIAFLLLAPLAFFTRRPGTNTCSMGWKNFSLICLLSFVGTTVNMNLYYEGLNLASSSATSALGNLIPAITFIMAYTIGLEKLPFRSTRSVAKIIGTITYNFTWRSQPMVARLFIDHRQLFFVVALANSPGMQSGVLTLIVEPNMKTWKLNSPYQLFCCFFGALGSAVTYLGQLWCVERRGPLFSAMFQPLSTVIVTLFACLFQHEELYMGSFMGSLAVITGLYIVLWGKAKDHEDVNGETGQTTLYTEVSDNESCTIDLKDPLLHGK
ncbi:UNVERIFIED_CONTAM: WAT1-related protein [Sesamum radiatum]|uniref:WAT1-related protein n=1 Tax=Sesamum radiatum TaxID=300843 RepID=A0AAW2UA52_SESRA